MMFRNHLSAGLLLLAATAGAVCPFAGSGPNPHKASTSPSWEGQIPMANDASDPLVILNNFFHTDYSDSRRKVLPTNLIIVEADYLVLYHGDEGTREVESSTPAIYHNLKMVCHLPLAVFVILSPSLKACDCENTSLDAATLATLTEYREQMDLVELNATRFDGDADVLLRNQRIIEATTGYIDQVLAAVAVNRDELTEFTAGLREEIDSNLDDAAAAQIGGIIAVMKKWKEEILTREEDWTHLRVFIASVHMARVGNLASQTFGRLFGVPFEKPNEIVFTVEETASEEDAFRLVGTHIMDYAAGSAFFNDEYRLKRDILSDGATKYLDEILPHSDDDDDDRLPPLCERKPNHYAYHSSLSALRCVNSH